jgi:exonuclease VII small subunit
MDGMSDQVFLDSLSLRLQEYGTDAERVAIPALKTSLTSLRSSYESLLGLLKRKGLVAEDPYQFSEKISEIKPISNEPFLENQRATLASIRMHQFESQLAFLADTYQLSLDALSLSNLRSLTQLVRYVRWESLTENHQETNTRIVAELVGRIRKSDDTISAGLVNDMVHQMALNVAKVFESLKKITLYKREEYKYLLRTSFWSDLKLSIEEINGNSENVQRRIKKEFATHLKGHPYIPDLVKELLDEDYGPSSQTLKDELLVKLRVVKEAPVKAKNEVEPRTELMEAVRTLATANIPLDAAIRKLHDTGALFDTAQDTLGERFQKWVRRLMGIKVKPRVLAIELVDPATGTTKREQIDLDAFQSEVTGRIRVLSGMSNRHGPQFTALGQKPEDEILAWFERQFLDLAKTVEKINGLDAYFKTEVPKEKRALVKGTKAEIAQIRTTMGNANKQRHEATARKEEVEQLKRLGIK